MKSSCRTLIQQFCFFISIVCLVLFHNRALGQASAEEITKKLSNPISSLISLPFQNNLTTGIGPLNGYQNTLNIQPVIPFQLSKDWNLITRVVMPIVTQTDVLPVPGTHTGLSDIVASAFFSPAKVSNGLIWGTGPAFLIPSATNSYLGTKKWGVGPTAAALFQASGWTFGILANQIWSYAGSANRDAVSQFYALPFVVHNWSSGAGVGVNADITRNWEHRYMSAVITPNISGLTHIGKQNFQLQAGPVIPVSAAPGEKPDFGFRTQITLVFPKK